MIGRARFALLSSAFVDIRAGAQALFVPYGKRVAQKKQRFNSQFPSR